MHGTNYLKENDLINGYFIQTDALQYSEDMEKLNYNDYKVEVPTEKISDVMVQLLNEKKQGTRLYIQDADKDKIEYTGESYYFDVFPYYYEEKTYNEILHRAGIEELKENECILVNVRKIENSSFGDSIELTKYEKR